MCFIPPVKLFESFSTNVLGYKKYISILILPMYKYWIWVDAKALANTYVPEFKSSCA